MVFDARGKWSSQYEMMRWAYEELFPRMNHRILATNYPGIFLITDYMRSWEEIDWTPEPDMWHDIFGHLPFMTLKPYAVLEEMYAPAFLAAKVRGDAFLVAAQAAPPVRRAVLVEHPPPAQRIAVSGRLHLDDLGAVVSQYATGERAGQQLAEFEDTDSIQWAGFLFHGGEPEGRSLWRSQYPTKRLEQDQRARSVASAPGACRHAHLSPALTFQKSSTSKAGTTS